MSEILFWNLFSTFFMTGLIWFVQLHYWLYKEVDESNFTRYEKLHSFFTFPIVMPPMIIEFITSYYLYIENSNSQLYFYNFLLVILVQLSTWIIQVPAHLKLMKSFSIKWYRVLVYSNWLRVILWSSKSYILYLILFQSH
jgi:hypothetical protein